MKYIIPLAQVFIVWIMAVSFTNYVKRADFEKNNIDKFNQEIAQEIEEKFGSN